jgi:hypothetical protein
MFIIRDREAGNIIESVSTKEAALTKFEEYEQTDKEDGTYRPDFYEIVEGEDAPEEESVITSNFHEKEVEVRYKIRIFKVLNAKSEDAYSYRLVDNSGTEFFCSCQEFSGTNFVKSGLIRDARITLIKAMNGEYDRFPYTYSGWFSEHAIIRL